MAVAFNKLVTPTSDDYTVETPHTNIAIGLGVVGIVIAMGVVAIALVAANDLEGGNAAQLLAYAFGLQTTALVTIKVAIAAALVGILVRLFGVYPMPLLNLMKASLNNLIKVVAG